VATSLEWMVVADRRIFNRSQGWRGDGNVESWKNRVTDFMRSRNVEEAMAEPVDTAW
jgi:hypothetical protein